MSDVKNKSSSEGWSRSAWVVFAVIFTVILIIQSLRWQQGFGRWENLLPAATLLVMALAHVAQLKGLAQRISQVICWGMLIVMVFMLIIR